MPKKDTNLAIASMLSQAGAHTRPRSAPLQHSETAQETPQRGGVLEADIRALSATVTPPQLDPDRHQITVDNERAETNDPSFALSGTDTAHVVATQPLHQSEKVPRTLRLRTQTAHDLRAAWVEAKRIDVFLTAQDFASDLIQEALLARRMRTTSSAL